MAKETQEGVHRIDVPTAHSRAIFTGALLTFPYSPCYGEIVLLAKGIQLAAPLEEEDQKKYIKDCIEHNVIPNRVMDLRYVCKGASSNIWFTKPAIAGAETKDHQNQNGEIDAILETKEADQINLNMGLSLRTNPSIFSDLKNNLLTQLQDAGYSIHSAELRLPSNHLTKAYSKSYDGNGLMLTTTKNAACACLTLRHSADKADEDKKADLQTWFALLQKANSL